MERSNKISWRLPEHMIAGTLFIYDSELNEFRERDVPSNRISMEGIWSDEIWTQFFFDNKTKNIYRGGFPDGQRPHHVQLIIMPTLPYCYQLGIRVQDYHEREKAKNLSMDNKRQNFKKSLLRDKHGRRI